MNLLPILDYGMMSHSEDVTPVPVKEMSDVKGG